VLKYQFICEVGAEVVSRGRVSSSSSDLGAERRHKAIPWFEWSDSEQFLSISLLLRDRDFYLSLLAFLVPKISKIRSLLKIPHIGKSLMFDLVGQTYRVYIHKF
jgi:hypothetical protein